MLYTTIDYPNKKLYKGLSCSIVENSDEDIATNTITIFTKDFAFNVKIESNDDIPLDDDNTLEMVIQQLKQIYGFKKSQVKNIQFVWIDEEDSEMTEDEAIQEWLEGSY
jgi:hypothetical protein